MTLHLERGAVLLGSTNPDDYRPQHLPGEPASPNAHDNSALALVVANGAHDIGVTGQGTIDGRGLELALNIDSLHHKGVRIAPQYNNRRHRPGEKPGYLRNIYIGQMKVEVPFGRPDEDYDLRGPAVTFFHNPIPSSVTGIPGSRVENVVIEDVEIRYPGRATKGMAYVPLWRLDAVPEAVEEYPEFIFCPLCCLRTAGRSGRSDRCGAAR